MIAVAIVIELTRPRLTGVGNDNDYGNENDRKEEARA